MSCWIGKKWLIFILVRSNWYLRAVIMVFLSILSIYLKWCVLSVTNALKRYSPFWVFCCALMLSLLGHFLLFFGLPFYQIIYTEPTEDGVLKAELKVEPPTKIKMSRHAAKRVSSNTSQIGLPSNIIGEDLLEQGDSTNQKGQAFRLPEPGIFYFDAYVDGQLYQRGELRTGSAPLNNFPRFISGFFAVVKPPLMLTAGF